MASSTVSLLTDARKLTIPVMTFLPLQASRFVLRGTEDQIAIASFRVDRLLECEPPYAAY